MRFKLELSYHGCDFHGWQKQPNAITVQQTLEESLLKILQQNIEIVGCGRTDTGVHARYYVAHFDADNLLDERFISKLNGILPNTIAIKTIQLVDANFHARFDAKSRTYEYIIATSKSPFDFQFSWYFQYALDLELMRKAAYELYRYQDFTSFSKLHTDVKTNNCKIFNVDFIVEDEKIIFVIKADRFLRNMVRAIVGTLVDVGRGKISFDEFIKIIEKKDRGEAGQSAPAQGLFLVNVEY